MTKQISRALCVLALALAVTPAAQAQFTGNGFYVEVGVGEAKFKNIAIGDLDAFTRAGFASINAPVQTLASTLSTKDRSKMLLTGYRISPYLSFETGFFRPGAFQYAATGTVSDLTNGGAILPASLTYSYRAKGFLLGGTGMLPLGKHLELRGRAGFSSTDTRVKFTATAGGVVQGQDNYSTNSQDFYFGAGVGLKFAYFYRVGLDLMRHNKLGSASGNGNTDVDNVLLTFSYLY